MNRVVLASLVVLTVGLAASSGAAGQSSRGLQGAWQLAEINITGPSARTFTFAEPRANLVIFTARHYSRVEVQSEKPRPLLPDASKATADELRTVWGPFVGEAGTYEVTGSSVTMWPIASKN